MSSTFVAGIIFAVAHHVYYSNLNDQIVGSSAKQQWSIRYTICVHPSALTRISDSALRSLSWSKCAMGVAAMQSASVVDKQN
jgi:hypothetical protein